MIKFFVEVDNENFKFTVKSISHKTFCVCEYMLRAEKICSLLNSNGQKTKQEYILLLVSCGVFDSFDSYTNCNNITKNILEKKYNKIIQKYTKSIKSIYKKRQNPK